MPFKPLNPRDREQESDAWHRPCVIVSAMKTITKLPLIALPIAFSLVSCDIDKTEEGELPEVEVKGEIKLPEYEVEGPDVKVEKKEIEVPTLDIDLPEEEDKPGQPATDPNSDE